jgi:hypothetical protein
LKARWHDANDGDWAAIERNALVQDIVSPRIFFSPEPLADHSLAFAARLVCIGSEGSTEKRPHTQCRKEAGAYIGAAQLFRSAIARQRESVASKCSEILERFAPGPPEQEILHASAPPASVLLRHAVVNPYQAIGILIWQWSQQNAVDHTECSRCDPDAKTEYRDRGPYEPG